MTREFEPPLILTSPHLRGQKVKDAQSGELIDRFLDQVMIDEDGCFYWLGPVSAKGYGFFNAFSRRRSAHRFSYELFVGPIPDGLEIDHLCRHRDCVNPAHLEAVTHRENVLRSDAPPANNARAKVCKFGHPFAGENVKVHPSGRRSCVTCDRARRERWRDRQDPAALRAYNADQMRVLRSRRRG